MFHTHHSPGGRNELRASRFTIKKSPRIPRCSHPQTKNFRFGERHQVQFRAEFFNFFNLARFSSTCNST
jgi:hypothetical protein